MKNRINTGQAHVFRMCRMPNFSLTVNFQFAAGLKRIVSAIVIILLARDCVDLSAEEAPPHESGAPPVLFLQTTGKAVQDRMRVPASLTVLLPEDRGSKFSIAETTNRPTECNRPV